MACTEPQCLYKGALYLLPLSKEGAASVYPPPCYSVRNYDVFIFYILKDGRWIESASLCPHINLGSVIRKFVSFLYWYDLFSSILFGTVYRISLSSSVCFDNSRAFLYRVGIILLLTLCITIPG